MFYSSLISDLIQTHFLLEITDSVGTNLSLIIDVQANLCPCPFEVFWPHMSSAWTFQYIRGSEQLYQAWRQARLEVVVSAVCSRVYRIYRKTLKKKKKVPKIFFFKIQSISSLTMNSLKLQLFKAFGNKCENLPINWLTGTRITHFKFYKEETVCFRLYFSIPVILILQLDENPEEKKKKRGLFSLFQLSVIYQIFSAACIALYPSIPPQQASHTVRELSFIVWFPCRTA